MGAGAGIGATAGFSEAGASDGAFTDAFFAGAFLATAFFATFLTTAFFAAAVLVTVFFTAVLRAGFAAFSGGGALGVSKRSSVVFLLIRESCGKSDASFFPDG